MIEIKHIGLVNPYKSPLIILMTFPESVSVNDFTVNLSILLYRIPVKPFLMFMDMLYPVNI